MLLLDVGAQLCPPLCDAMGCSPPGFPVHGIFQERVLEWGAISSSRGSSQPRDWTCLSCLASISNSKYLTQDTTFLNKQFPQIKPADIWHNFYWSISNSIQSLIISATAIFYYLKFLQGPHKSLKTISKLNAGCPKSKIRQNNRIETYIKVQSWNMTIKGWFWSQTAWEQIRVLAPALWVVRKVS